MYKCMRQYLKKTLKCIKKRAVSGKHNHTHKYTSNKNAAAIWSLYFYIIFIF